jgi:hypothetical protein
MMIGPAPIIRTECMSVRFGINRRRIKAIPSELSVIKFHAADARNGT